MNKLFTKIATLSVGLAMAVGVGLVVDKSDAKEVLATGDGSQANPYTVAEARAAIDAGTGVTGVYATGIVTGIVTSYNGTYHNISFNISEDGDANSDLLQAYRCKGNQSGAYQITKDADIEVGATVVIYGNLKSYKGTYEFDANCYVTSYTAPSGTMYSVTSNITNGSLSVDEVLEGSNLVVSIVPNVGYWYPSTLAYVRVNGVDVDYTYGNGIVRIENVQGNVVIAATCAACNPVQSLYAMPSGTDVEFDAYYAGDFADGVIVMDGQYGMLLYQFSVDNGWTVDETVLHVTARTKIYNNLYELENVSADVQDDDAIIANIAKPQNYTLSGSESISDLTVANRRTFITGTVVSITASSNNYNIVMNDGVRDLNLYLKSKDNKSFTWKDSTESTISAYLQALGENDVVTIKGFTSFYTNFQARVYGIIEPDDSYTVEGFAEKILNDTDAVCAGYDGSANNLSALTPVWGGLNDYWQEMPIAERNKFLSNTYVPNYDNDSANPIENALGRYNMICKKYFSNDNFTGRSDVNGAPVVSNGLANFSFSISENTTNISLIIVVAAIGFISLAGIVVLKKKHQ